MDVYFYFYFGSYPRYRVLKLCCCLGIVELYLHHAVVTYTTIITQ